MNKNKIFFLTSIFLLFFICLPPIQTNAAEVNCKCTGEIEKITESECTGLLQEALCDWTGGKCICDTGNVAVEETNCNDIGLFNELNIQLPSEAQPNMSCSSTPIAVQESAPDECNCDAIFPSGEVGPTSCETMGQISGVDCNKTGSVSDGTFKCHCRSTRTVTNLQCKPETLSDFGDKQSHFCCTFDDGTQTNYTYPDGTQANACQEIADAGGINLGTGPGTGEEEITGPGTGEEEITGPGTGEEELDYGPRTEEVTEEAVEAQTQELPNFLGTTDVNEVIGRIVRAIIGISGSFALAVFIYGGALWMFSGGNPERVKKGRSAMIYAAIGLVVIFLSYTLVNFILRALG